MNYSGPKRKKEFNPVGPMGYLITFRTYGTWLHGDKRGSVNRKENIPGTPVINANTAFVKKEASQLKHPPVRLDTQQRSLVEQTIRDVADHNKWILHALNALPEHVHIVLTAMKRPEPVMNSIKSWCTRRLRENELISEDINPWTRHGSTRYLWDEKDVHDACVYVMDFQD